jgi:Ca2+-dependent lipid-binding protein
MELH